MCKHDSVILELKKTNKKNAANDVMNKQTLYFYFEFRPVHLRCTTHTHANTHANTSQSSCSQESLLIWSLSAGAGINKSKARNSRVLCSEPGASRSLSLSLWLTPSLGVCVCVPARVCVHACESKRPHWQCWTHLTIIWCSGPEAGVENDLDCPGPQHQQHREQKKTKKNIFY